MVVCALAATLNINPVLADPELTAEDCLYKDECIPILSGSNVYISRKGEPVDTIDQMGGPLASMYQGYLTVGGVWMVTSWEGETILYIYNVEQDYHVQLDVSRECRKGVIYNNNTLRLPCPANNGYVVVSLVGSPTFTFETSQLNYPNSVAAGRDYLFGGGLDSKVERMAYSPGTPFEMLTSLSAINSVQYWQDPQTTDTDDNDLVFFHDGASIYSLGPHNGSYGEVLFSESLFPIDLGLNNTHLVATISSGAMLFPISNPTSAVQVSVQNAGKVVVTPNTFYVMSDESSTKAFDMNGTAIPLWDLGGGKDLAYMAPIYPPVCGNGRQEDDPLTTAVEEICDGTDMDGKTCQNLPEAFDGGELQCNSSCSAPDTSNCFYTCGNNNAAPTEECDGSDLKAQTCESLGYLSGNLVCTGSCEFDFSGCESCGNNRIDFDETCDGSEFGTTTCLSEGFDGGRLTCNSTCDEIDTSGCTVCGDGVIEGEEMCEGEDLNGHTCESLGFGKGTLTCSNSCTPDVSLCPPPPDGAKKKGCNTSGSDSCVQGIPFVLMIAFALLIRRRRNR